MDQLTIGLALASQFAPHIIKYFTNSDTAATVAGQVIDIAKTVTGKETPDAALEAMKLDPALALQFKTAVMANETDLEKAYLADVQSARDRDAKLAAAGILNHRANALVAMSVFMVVVCLAVVIWMSELDEYAKGTITLILGRALGWVEQIFSFEFGTTRSSKAKDDTITRLSGR